MLKQTDKVTALYYRAAHINKDNMNLDNQMQSLLCYAKEQVFVSFIVYADNGFSGLNLDRPAFNALQSDIQAERVGKVVVLDVARIGRNIFDVMRFEEWAQAHSAKIICINGGCVMPEHLAVYRSLAKGGELV